MTAVIGLSFVTCQHPYVGVALLVLGVATIGCQYGGGFLVNYNDVCGRYSGMTLGIANTFASVPGVLAPFFVSFITKNVILSKKLFCRLTNLFINKN
jgi:ACS family sodium-dependent inorganic phosphate cotransporter-like MFS transporter 5